MPEPITAAVAALKADAISGFNYSTLLWGGLGAAVSMRFAKLTWWEKITTVAAGAITAQALGPLAATFFKVPDYQSSIAFLFGVFGLSLCAAIIAYIKEDLRGAFNDVKDAVVARISTTKKDPEA